MPRKPARSEHPKVIVINDSVTQLAMMVQLLRKAGLTVTPFENAAEALEAMSRDEPPDLIVTDISMPGIDGWHLSRLLRSSAFPAFHQVPILVVSSTFSQENASQVTADLGADAFLPLPIDGPSFLSAVQTLLQGDRQSQSPQVLLVQNDGPEALILQDAFIRDGYQVMRADSGSAARRLFVKHKEI